jgi:hypothetical protein
MQMRPALQIQSMIKAMMDVVLPAVDPSNKLALEQSRLVIGMLSLMAQQLPLQFRFDCDELSRLLKLAAALQHAARGGPQTTACIDSVAAAPPPAPAPRPTAHARPPRPRSIRPRPGPRRSNSPSTNCGPPPANSSARLTAMAKLLRCSRSRASY